MKKNQWRILLCYNSFSSFCDTLKKPTYFNNFFWYLYNGKYDRALNSRVGVRFHTVNLLFFKWLKRFYGRFKTLWRNFSTFNKAEELYWTKKGLRLCIINKAPLIYTQLTTSYKGLFLVHCRYASWDLVTLSITVPYGEPQGSSQWRVYLTPIQAPPPPGGQSDQEQ